MITEAARAWAARDYPDSSFLVTARDIHKYASAIGETDRIYYDSEAAQAAGYVDVVAPPFFPYVIRMHAAHLVGRDQLEPDGSATVDVPPLETTRAMAGETTIDLGEPVVAGDLVTVTKKIIDMYEKGGRSGALVFVTMEFVFTNQRDELVAREQFTRIYR